mmetsp:Transcript_12386/g.29121  ORF Transcript_12386/g.29121 Transcript_12386/m.29121 type:complete len:728 (+) Transcript_12386:10-2193(+)
MVPCQVHGMLTAFLGPCTAFACAAYTREPNNTIKKQVSSQVMQLPCDEVLQACFHSDHEEPVSPTRSHCKDSLHRALLCCGLCADTAKIRSALSTLKLRSPYSVSDVRNLAVHLLESGCTTCRPVVPHCQRGVRLRDLRKMDETLIATGWLKHQCEDHNSADAVKAGRSPFLQEDLYGLDQLFTRDATSGHVPEELVPVLGDLGVAGTLHSEDPCSFSELLCPMGLKEVHFYVSHFWGHPFTATVDALSDFALSRDCVANVGDALSFWICAFCLNQHMITAELGETPDDAPFNIALAKVKHGMVMVLDDALNPFRRIWCLYEVSRAHDLGRKFCVLAEHHSQDAGLAQDSVMSASNICHSLLEVSSCKALASCENDKLAILHRIVDASQKTRFGDLASFMHRWRNPSSKLAKIDGRFFQDFDNSVRELLSTPLFHAELQMGQLEEAMQYAIFADFSVSDLQRLIELKGDITRRMAGLVYGELAMLTLLHKAARQGSDTVRYLIAMRADIESPLETIHAPGEGIIAHLQDHTTPLHVACKFGNVAAVEILLDAGADVLAESGSSRSRMPPLHFAVTGGGEAETLAIVKLLVQRSAEVLSIDAGQNSLLHQVVCQQGTAVTDFVLKQGHPVNVADGDGATPLHVAANWGMVGQIRLLCEHKADVAATKIDGATPLHRAARSGHAEATNSLLLHRGNVHATDGAGLSPIEAALQAGHVALSQSMLLHMES